MENGLGCRSLRRGAALHAVRLLGLRLESQHPMKFTADSLKHHGKACVAEPNLAESSRSVHRLENPPDNALSEMSRKSALNSPAQARG